MRKKTLFRAALTLASFFFFFFHITAAFGSYLFGYVLYEEGQPFSGAWITIPGAISVRSTDSGAFLQEVEDGTYTLTVSSPGYIPKKLSNITVNGDTFLSYIFLSLDLSVSPQLALTGQAANFTLRGHGFDPQTRAWLTHDFGSKASISGTVDPPGNVYDVVTADNIAYIAAGHEGLYVVDVRDPYAPRIIGNVDGGDLEVAMGVDVIGDYAYVAHYKNGGNSHFYIVDISVPSAPAVVGDVIIPGETGRLKVSGNYAYVTEGDNGLRIIDISTPSSPQLKDPVDTPGDASDVSIQGDRAYVADYFGGLQIIDITNPEAAYILADVDTDIAFGVDVEGNYAYIAASIYGLQIIDLQVLEIISSMETFSSASRVVVENNTAYVSDTSGGLLAIDISNPQFPKITGHVNTPGTSVSTSLMGDYACVADSGDGLQIIDTKNMVYTESAHIVQTPGNALSFAQIGTNIYVADSYEGLQVIDVNDPYNPHTIGHLDLGVKAISIATDATTVYITGGTGSDGLQIVDVSTPEAPFVRSEVATPGLPRDVDVAGNYAYIADWSEGLQVIDISNLDAPKIVGNDNSISECVRVSVSGDYAYVTDQSQGLKVVDISDPTSPSVVGEVDAIGANLNARVIGQFVYFLNNWDGLQIVDVSTPTAPFVRGSINTPGNPRDISVAGDIAYIADHWEGLQIIDVSNPDNPEQLGTLKLPGNTIEVTMGNNIAHLITAGDFYTLVPLDNFFTELSLQFVSDSQMNINGVTHNLAGDYNLFLQRSLYSLTELPGAITFTDNSDLFHAKAIIVAGGGPEASGDIWPQTMQYADFAYRMLKNQGYTDSQIYYLTDQATASWRDAPADRTSLENAFSWATTPPTSSLILYLVDHGEEELFQLRGGDSAVYVTAEELDDWLDELQDVTDAKVLTVYDACKSGSFPFKLTPSIDKTRVNITSAAADQSAYFLSEKGSFSSHFWSVFSGRTGERADVPSAWKRGLSSMASYQTAQLDANSNGLTNEPEDFTSLIETDFPFGRQWFDSRQRRPGITTIGDEQILSDGGTSALLSVTDPYDYDGDVIVRVWADILAPDITPPDGNLTVTSGITVDLVETSTTGVYQSEYAGFMVKGTYIITYHVLDSDGLVSLPQTGLLIQNAGDIAFVPDEYEPDNGYTEAQVINVNAPTAQYHTFHISGDEDWVRFYALEGETYEIKVDKPSPINNPAIELYGPDNESILQASQDKYGSGGKEVLTWTCLPENGGSGIYSIKLSNNTAHFGGNVSYELKVYTPIALSLPGYVTGILNADVDGSPVSGAILHAGSGSGISSTNGSFLLSLPSGSTTVSVSKAGFLSTECQLTVVSSTTMSCGNITMQRVNSAPVISGTAPTTLYSNEFFSFTPSVSDDSWDIHTFSISAMPSWCSFSSSTGTLTGTPDNSAIGSHGPVTLFVTDYYGSSDSLTFTMNVFEGSNIPPTIGGSPPRKIRSSSLFNFTPTTYDPNADPVAFSISGQPEWTSFNSENGNLSGVPGPANTGLHGPVTIRATDSHGAYSSLTFTINVLSEEEFDRLGSLPAVFNVLLLQEK